ncbi:DUF967 domain protein [Aspergillus fijiensis CBS 313.89]|uniref:Uncharacterized protein n=1 Tax=Aspergillus fijiensis CBS 313.89 TaxID=1448319 RepID=A0A8G1RM95_9EURO|nr:uncharacterized protein BO72DRAFT_529501 [Aspergillus fijiensis CBS 313.89]RAK75359.1 hypothetical protein BO72DRAFT_529501 [Aspergillus fijiensis CBS 313.89]
MEDRPLTQVSTDPITLTAHETSPALIFSTFTATTAFNLGLALRDRILSLPATSRKPALISITLTTAPLPSSFTDNQPVPPHVVFQCATEPGTIPDNEVWVRRKRNTVLRWGVSSTVQSAKFSRSEILHRALNAKMCFDDAFRLVGVQLEYEKVRSSLAEEQFGFDCHCCTYALRWNNGLDY